MATVELAEDTRLGRLVALKRMAGTVDVSGLSRLRREALAGASLNHPNLVSVYDILTLDDGDLVIVMEYVDGETLRDRLSREGKLAPSDALPLLAGVASGLDAIHGAGIVHRDVKPSNILLGEDGAVKVADLGVASVPDRTQITITGSIIGSLNYMAPEQLESGPATPALDVYALSAVAFEVLSGVKAREAPNPVALAHEIATKPPPSLSDAWPEAPRAVTELLRRGMSRAPRDRPASAGELVAGLEAGFRARTPKRATARTPRIIEAGPAAAARAPPGLPATARDAADRSACARPESAGVGTRGPRAGRGVRGRGAPATAERRELSVSEEGGVGREEALAHLKVAFGVHVADDDGAPLGQQYRHLDRVGAGRLGLDRHRLDDAHHVHVLQFRVREHGLRRRSSLRFLIGRHTGRRGRVLLPAGRGAALLRGMGAGRPGVPRAARRVPQLPGGAGQRPVDHVQQRPRREPDAHILDGVGEHDVGPVRWNSPLQRPRRSGFGRSGPVAGASDSHQLHLSPLAQGRLLGPELLDRRAGHVLLCHELRATIDGGDERRMRDPERGAQVASRPRAVQLGKRLDGGVGERLLAG